MMMKTVGAFLLVGGVTAAGLVGGSHLMQAAMAQGADPYRTLDTLAQALHHIEDQYIEPHPTGLLVEGAITGMTEKLDAHSTYLDPDDLKAAQVRTEGVYSGVGLELKTIDDAITVVRVVPGSPADGRVARGAQLTAVDGVGVERLSEASAALRGSEGTDVRLKLRVGDDDETVSLKRQRIRDRTVRVERLQRRLGLRRDCALPAEHSRRPSPRARRASTEAGIDHRCPRERRGSSSMRLSPPRISSLIAG